MSGVATFDFTEFVRIEATIKALGNQKIFLKEFRPAFKKIGREYTKTIVRERLSGRPGLKKRSGNLRRAFSQDVSGETLSELTLVIGVGCGLRYAAIQEFGGLVFPVRASNLAIPLTSVQTFAGVQRFQPKDLKPTFVYKARDGRLFVARGFRNITEARSILKRSSNIISFKDKKSGRVVVLLFKLQPFARHKSPGRFELRKTFEREDVAARRREIIEAATERALRRAGFK